MPSERAGSIAWTRREFLQLGALAGLATWAGDWTLAAEAGQGPDVWVFHGADKAKLMAACMKTIGENGGLGKQVKSLAVKVNAAWSRTPEEGANTHPEVVAGLLKGCKELGAEQIVVAENSCHRAEETFARSGILPAVTAAGATMLDLKKHKSWKSVNLPGARKLTEARVAAEFLESDVVINLPVAKHHGGATLSMALKNWMGAVEDRGFWHRNDLHQCIADVGTLLKPTWTVIDATRIMLDKGPQGPSENMKHPDLVILSRDQVAADCLAATLFHSDPMKVRYLKIAREMNLGETRVEQMNIHKIETA